MIDIKDLEKLNDLVASLKEDSESTSQFTIDFLECLQKRYNLKIALSDQTEIVDIPEEIIQILKSGNVPTKEELLALDSETQYYLIMEMVWFSGMSRIAAYSHDLEIPDGEPTPIECILAMQEVSSAHFHGSYLFAALTLLMSAIPSYDFVSTLCNNFDDSPQNIQNIVNNFIEVCWGIYSRNVEDITWFYNFKEDEI